MVGGVARTKAITRQVFGPLPTCTFGAQPDLALATNFQDMWWTPSESGWGIGLAQQGNTIFAAWFTYDPNGAPMWVSFSATQAQPGGAFTGTLYRTSGPPFSTVPFNPANVQRTPVGTATLTFTDGNNATFAYNLLDVAQSKHITREVFQGSGTVCQ